MWNLIGNALTGAITGQTGKIVNKVVGELIEQVETSNYTSKVTEEVIAILDTVPGISQAHSRDLKRARPMFSLKDRTVVKFYQNLLFEHIFIADSEGKLIHGGFVNPLQADGLKEAIIKIRREFT